MTLGLDSAPGAYRPEDYRPTALLFCDAISQIRMLGLFVAFQGDNTKEVTATNLRGILEGTRCPGWLGDPVPNGQPLLPPS